MTESHDTFVDLLTRARESSQTGRLEESVAQYRELLGLQQDNPDIYFELGVVALRQGDFPAAIEQLQQAIDLDAGRPEFHNSLGIVFSTSGDLAAGARCFERVLELDPANARACNNLGSNFKDQGRTDDAIRSYRKAIEINARYLAPRVNLGGLLARSGRLFAAADAYRAALSIDPERVNVQFGLATVMHLLGHDAEAIELFRQVEAREPNYPNLYNNLGLAIAKQANFELAISCFREAARKDPASAAPHVNQGNALQATAQVESALACYRDALAIRPDHAAAHSCLLLAMNYLPRISQEQLYSEARRFEAQQTVGDPRERDSFDNSRDAKRVLRIGYLSPDFTSHSVSHFTRKLIAAHDRNRVEVYCYFAKAKRDEVTDEIEARADRWRVIVGLSDDEVVAQIRDDRIDILIDLAGHTAQNRLLVFARRAAPVQVSWLGYPNTTGLSSMDYRLTDAVADPPGVDDRWYTEELIRLPHGFLCYQSDQPEPAVAAAPCVERGHVTFGSFNNLPKLTSQVVRTWSRILNEIPGSRLRLKSSALADERARSRIIDEFGAQGIPAARLELLGLIPGRQQHLAAYAGVDVALDTYPYNGTTTTCEALWMGIPVVALRGNRHSGRVGASILHHAGLPELVADTEDDYIEIAVALARDPQRIVGMRERLRPMMQDSCLMDTLSFARSLETAYRDMWAAWCEDPSR